MATTSAPSPIRITTELSSGGRGGGSSDLRSRRVVVLPRASSAVAAETGVWVAVAAISMCFASLISALIVRQGIAPDWLHFELPRILYFNTLILLASSFALEASRRSLGKRLDAGTQESPNAQASPGSIFWLCVAIALGGCFVVGQFVAWSELAAKGLLLASSPSSSFFYVLTAAHGLHLLGGMMGLVYALYRIGRSAGPREKVVLGVTSVYWHFMDGLWVFLFVVLAVRT